MEGYTDSVNQKNTIRKLIKSYFQERYCYTFVQPSTDEETLQNLNSYPIESLRKEFYEQVLSFRRQMFDNIKIKTVKNKPISGSGLSYLLNSYIEAINSGVIPNIENSYEQVAVYENDRLVRKALEM